MNQGFRFVTFGLNESKLRICNNFQEGDKMPSIEQPLQYRYIEIAYTLINNMVNTAFTASRYALQPPEPTKDYLDRLNLTTGIIQQRYVEALAKSLELMMTSPENPQARTDFESDHGVQVNYDQNDPYESALDVFDSTLLQISHDLADPAYNLDIEEIKKQFQVDL